MLPAPLLAEMKHGVPEERLRLGLITGTIGIVTLCLVTHHLPLVTAFAIFKVGKLIHPLTRHRR
jgi:hypothetical protein